MEELTKTIVRDAELEAETIVKEAKKQQQQALKTVKEKIKSEFDGALKRAKSEGELNAIMEVAKLKRQAKSDVLSERQKILNELKAAVEEQLIKKSEHFFKETIKEGKKIFKKPVIEVGKAFTSVLKKMKVSAKEVDNLIGMRIGEDGYWLSVEIPDIVDAYFEENYSEIVKELFGE